MGVLLSRCGYRCDLCLAFKPNLKMSPSNRQVLSDGWFKYFGFRIPAEEISCDGCITDSPTLIDRSCPVRPCVIVLALENCSQCDGFANGCEKLTERMVDYQDVQQRVGLEIPDDDYQLFIHPYENKRRLEALKR
jgi:hypothetical protein